MSAASRASPPEPELLVRWIGFGVFTPPRFSIHSWNEGEVTTEPWMHPETLDTARALRRPAGRPGRRAGRDLPPGASARGRRLARAWTGDLHAGGTTVELEAPWDRPPYLSRHGRLA